MKNAKRRILILLIVSAICLVLAGIFQLVVTGLAKKCPSQYEAEQIWSYDAEWPYAQISSFLTAETAPNVMAMENVRMSIDNALTADSYAVYDGKTRVWTDCYSSELQASYSVEETSCEARTIITGGDYFLFHPHTMIAGWPYDREELMEDGIVINRDLAWRLYGGVDLVGMTINVNGNPCIIVGVTDGPAGKAENEQYGSEPTAYFSYALAQKIGVPQNITCFEAVLPNPVKDYALKTIKTATGFSEDTTEFVVSTNRYSFVNRVKKLFSKNDLVTKTNSIVYTYAENAARVTDSTCRLLTALTLLCLLFPLLCILALIVLLYINKKKLFLGLIQLLARPIIAIKHHFKAKKGDNT